MVAGLVILFLMVTAPSENLGHSVSYPPFGTFTNDPPFHKQWMLLPQSPAQVGTEFHLFTRQTSTNGHILDSLRPSTIHSSTLDPSRKTVFISHGFNGGFDSPMNIPMKNALLKRDDINVVIVAWYNGSHVGYSKAAANCRLVGAQIAHLVEALHKEVGLAPSLVHVVGYSLGAHVAGYAGSTLKTKGYRIARITGLDSAGPLFENEDIGVRLDKTDAEFVDGIHTSTQKFAIGSGLGMALSVGHIDFYVNGGAWQPGCLRPSEGWEKILSCSHRRSNELFTESINGAEQFKGYPCTSYGDFLRGNCISCPADGCPTFGYNAINQKGLSTGKFYLKTGHDSPYLVDHYKVTFKTGSSLFGDLIGGIITIEITGSKGVSDDVIFQRRTMPRGKLQSFVAGVRSIGEPTGIKISHVDPFQKWNLKKIVVRKFESNAMFIACTDVWLNSKNSYFILTKKNDGRNTNC